MSPTDEEKLPQRAQDDIANPFIAFRRFADDQMATLMNGIFGLSTLFTSSPSSSDAKVEDYQAWLQEARASRQVLEREAEEAGRIIDVYTKAFKDSARGDTQRTSQDDVETLRCPYRPAGQGVPQHQNDDTELVRPSFGLELPHTCIAAPLFGSQLFPMPLGYLLYSPYSPLQLEHHQALRNRGIPWREAFEDLVAVQRGVDISSELRDGNPLSNIDWVKGMIGLVANQRDLQNQFHNVTEALGRASDGSHCYEMKPQPETDVLERQESQVHENDSRDDDETDQITEYDLYKYFLGTRGLSSDDECSSNSDAQTRPQPSAHPESKSARTNDTSSKPNVLATLTKTERTTLQDGTIHTKAVLKKRFSDGREECTETSHTQNPDPELRNQPPLKAVENHESSQGHSDPEDKAKKSKGWFWS